MHIGLFGGAFDPPHLGHAQVTHSLIEKKIVDEVWYLPVKHHHFEKKMSALDHRLAMLEMLVRDQKQTRIELYETKQSGINYTYLTLKSLSQEYPEHTFSFVIGSDNLSGFDRWLAVHPNLLHFAFLVYPRAGFTFKPLYPNMTPLTGLQTVTVSSTEVRENIQHGKSISHLVDKRVEEYIDRERLYL